MIKIKETNLTFGSLSKRKTTTRIILHHSASHSGDAKTFHTWHKNNGWAGIGYHFVILKDGTIERGRPIDTIGAHAQGYNSNSIGICCVGNFQGNSKPTTKQYKSMIELCKTLVSMYPTITDIIGHRDVCATACPCNLDVQKVKSASIHIGHIAPNKFLTYGAKCNEVKQLQLSLNHILNCKLVVDGIYGYNTKKAVMDFQSKYMGKLEVDGIYGKKTYNALSKVLKN